MSTPFWTRRGFPNAVGLVSACTSTRIGRVPSMVTAIADPDALTMRSERKSSDGFFTSFSPLSTISKTPTSDVAP